MKDEKQTCSPKALYDFELVTNGMAIVVEFKMFGGGIASQWWVTGLNSTGDVALLLQMQLGLSGNSEEDATMSCEEILPSVVALAKSSASAGGLNSPLVLPPTWSKAQFALAHLRLLGVAGVINNSGGELAQATALQYQLCNALGITKQVELMAEFLGVPVSTVRRRLAKARDLGYLQKRRQSKSEGGSNG
jgi:hypothetical protein